MTARRVIIKGMTGFGAGAAERDGVRFEVEIKGVNNRFLDQRVKLPAEFAGAGAGHGEAGVLARRAAHGEGDALAQVGLDGEVRFASELHGLLAAAEALVPVRAEAGGLRGVVSS